MKASELRIGNLVNLGNRVAKVIEISHSFCVVVDLEETQDTIESYERTKPIPLTEEWLLKFGFSHDKILGKRKFSIPFVNVVQRHEEFYLDYNGFIRIIKSVHQLQNIFHALTGKELEFKKITQLKKIKKQ
jgi:tRNA uridine 5-carbamoylmethylation protein Kti12